MIFGSVFSGGFGDPDKWLSYFNLASSGAGSALDLIFSPATGFGNQYFGIYRNTRFIKSVYVAEGDSSGVIVIAPESGKTSQLVTVVAQGASSLIDQSLVCRYMDSIMSNSVLVSFEWPVDIQGATDATNATVAWLSSWSLTGLSYSSSLPGESQTRRNYQLTSVVTGSSVTLKLYGPGGWLASTGTGAFPGTVTMTGSIYGTVAVGTAVNLTGAFLDIRYPKIAKVYRDYGLTINTLVGETTFNQSDSSSLVDGALVGPGSYLYRVKCTSDTDVEGPASADMPVSVIGPPKAPTSLRYVSGAASALAIAWTASTTAGATYNVYMQQIADPTLNLVIPVASPSGTSVTLPAAVGYPGFVRVIVRAVYGGVEEKNSNLLTIELDSNGAVVSKRPSVPTIQETIFTSGTTVTVKGTYLTVNEAVQATKLQLFSRIVGGAYDFTTPDAEGTLGSLVANGLKQAAITKTYVNGWRYLTLKSATVAGVQSRDYSSEVLVYVSSEAPGAPTGSAVAARG